MNYLYLGLAVALFGGGVYVGRLTVEVPTEKATIKTDQAQVQQEAKELQTNAKAEAQHDKDIETPLPLIIREPVWLQPPPAIIVRNAPQAPNQCPTAGAADAGPSIDLRSQLAEFAKKYETALSDCRRMAAEWPH